MASSSKQNTDQLKESKASSLEPKTEALYAFRTISTMLSLIQATRGRSAASKRPKKVYNRDEKRILQLLDAFAALLVRKNGVFAVTAIQYGSGKVEVLASYLGHSKEESLTISQPKFSGQFMNILRSLFISQNPRDSTIKEETLGNPEASIPIDFKSLLANPSNLLASFLTSLW